MYEGVTSGHKGKGIDPQWWCRFGCGCKTSQRCSQSVRLLFISLSPATNIHCRMTLAGLAQDAAHEAIANCPQSLVVRARASRFEVSLSKLVLTLCQKRGKRIVRYFPSRKSSFPKIPQTQPWILISTNLPPRGWLQILRSPKSGPWTFPQRVLTNQPRSLVTRRRNESEIKSRRKQVFNTFLFSEVFFRRRFCRGIPA